MSAICPESYALYCLQRSSQGTSDAFSLLSSHSCGTKSQSFMRYIDQKRIKLFPELVLCTCIYLFFTIGKKEVKLKVPFPLINKADCGVGIHGCDTIQSDVSQQKHTRKKSKIDVCVILEIFVLGRLVESIIKHTPLNASSIEFSGTFF